MTAIILIMDFLVYAFTPYSFHLVVLVIPFLNSFYPILAYFLILSILEPRYLANILILYALYKLNTLIDSRVRKANFTFLLKILLFYTLYVLLLHLFRTFI